MENNEMYFSYYGFLKWLEPTQYYAEPWSYHCSAEGDDGEQYDIVRNEYEEDEFRYTIV